MYFFAQWETSVIKKSNNNNNNKVPYVQELV